MGNVYIFRGKAATGKTTLSNLLAQRLSIPVFRKDDIVDGLKKSGAIQKGGAGSEASYNVLCSLVQTNLNLHTDFILDIALGDRKNAALFFSRLDFKENTVLKFFIDCSDEEEWKRRHRNRLENPKAHESFRSLSHVMNHYKKGDIKPFDGEYVIDTVKPVQECFSELLALIEKAGGI